VTTLQPGDSGYNPPLEAALRAVRAEARRAERIRILDDLSIDQVEAEGSHRNSKRGRETFGLRRARELIDPKAYDDGPWTEQIGMVITGCDTAEVGIHPEDEEAPMPVRLRVHDGAEGTTADAYMSIDDTDQLIEALQLARDRARAAQQAILDAKETAEEPLP
jgi:hypothetical protein